MARAAVVGAGKPVRRACAARARWATPGTAAAEDGGARVVPTTRAIHSIQIDAPQRGLCPVPSPSVLACPITAQRMELNACVVWRDSVVLQTRGVR